MENDMRNSQGTTRATGRRPISCDQVAWLLDVFDRYLPPCKHVSVSREREMMKYGMLYEVMEVAGLEFEDDAARRNGTPSPARKYNEDQNRGLLNAEKWHGDTPWSE